MMTSTIALNRRGQQAFADVQRAHAILMRAGGGVRHLWAHPTRETLIVQHPAIIDWDTTMSDLVKKYATVPVTTPQAGATIRWALIATPTAAKKQPEGRSKIMPLPESQWTTWLHRKLTPALDITTMIMEPLPTIHGRKSNMVVTHHPVSFAGEAIVTDPDTLHTLREQGVGRGKAYGCGLLLIGGAQ